MRSLEAALSFRPKRLPAVRAAIQQLHVATRSQPRPLDRAQVSALRARIEEAASAQDAVRALASLARSLVPRELLVAVRSIGLWTELRGAVAAIARERPKRGYVAELWRVWQAHPGSGTVVELLADMGERFGMQEAVGDRYSRDAAKWFGESTPVDSIVRWTASVEIGWKELERLPESPFISDAPLVDRVFRRTLQIGSAEQLRRLTNADILVGWRAMAGANHRDACANFLERIGPARWTGRAPALEEVRANYGLPGAEGSHRTFWGRLSEERRRDFREYFITKELDHAFKGDSDRHRFWMAQRREILDVCHGMAGTTEWSLIDFPGFSVVEFFELGNAAYLYPAEEPMLKRIRWRKRASHPSELKKIMHHLVPSRAASRHDNRIIHSGGWQYSATQILNAWKERYS